MIKPYEIFITICISTIQTITVAVPINSKWGVMQKPCITLPGRPTKRQVDVHISWIFEVIKDNELITTIWVDGTPTTEVTPVTIWYIHTPDLGHQMVMIMVMNDLLTPPLSNVNRPSHSEIQLFQNLTMKIHGQGHVCGQRSRSHLNMKIHGQCHGQGQTRWSHLSPRVQSIYLLFASWQSDHFWLRYSKFHIWPWKFNVNVMTKIDQNLIR